MILALTAHYDWEAHQVDVKTAFLNAPLAEDVYMTIPEGVDDKGGAAGNCVKLDKALYGLKQASRAWNHELVRFLKHLGFQQLFTDPYVFVRGTADSNFVIIVLHVDNQNIFATSIPLIDDLKAALRA